MDILMQKRFRAVLIDLMISNGVTLVVEPILKKKIKNEFFHVTVTQTTIFWGLEYVQMKLTGQTAGHRLQGIRVESEDGTELTSGQIIKRMIHRDFASPFDYWQNREKYHAYHGAKFPHDLYAGTVVREE